MRLVLACFLSLLALDSSAQSWSEITPTMGSAPLPRRHAGVIHDPVGHRLIVFAGESATGRLDDIWAFDLALETWTDLTPTVRPAARRTPSVVYDPVGHQMLMWSGQSGGTFFDDTWAFDLTTHSWSQFSPSAPIPGRRYGTASIYDPVAATLVTFAGFTFQGRFDDTWRFDPALDAWSEVTPAVNPLLRCLHSASYDAREHRMIMYGGQSTGPLDDIWAFDLTTQTWTELTPATRPAGRFFTAHVYDARNHRATIFGGTQGAAGGNTNEVWLFNLHNDGFLQMSPSGTPPSPRFGSSGIYLDDEDRMVVFGGHDGSYLNELWSLENLSQTVTAAPTVPVASTLLAVHPNPFNPRATLTFRVDRAGPVELTVFDVAGRRVHRLIRRDHGAGTYDVTWDGTDDDGRPLGSGVYHARLRTSTAVETRKLVLVR